MREFITTEQVEKALNYLRDTAEDFAKWKSRARFLELHRKSVRAAYAIGLTDGAMNLREAKAEASDEYAKVVEELEEALREFTLLEAERNAAQTKIDAWQTMEASNRRGHI